MSANGKPKRVVFWEHPDGRLERSSEAPGHEPGAILRPLVKLPKDPSKCWEWIGKTLSNGYGTKTYCGRTLLAHRWVWTLLLGPINDDLVIDHMCTNRACVNPHHLRVVTQTENIRSGAGTTLTIGDVQEARRLHADGWRCVALAERYGVTPSTMSAVLRGKTWRSHSKRVTKPRAADQRKTA